MAQHQQLTAEQEAERAGISALTAKHSALVFGIGEVDPGASAGTPGITADGFCWEPSRAGIRAPPHGDDISPAQVAVPLGWRQHVWNMCVATGHAVDPDGMLAALRNLGPEDLERRIATFLGEQKMMGAYMPLSGDQR